MPESAVCPGCQRKFDPMTPYRAKRGATGYRKRKWCSKECRLKKDHEKLRLERKRTGCTKPNTVARNAQHDSGKRTMIDPATCEREYTDEEREFLMALDRYKREAKRPWPTNTEILQVLLAMGYRRVAEPAPLPTRLVYK